MRSRLTQDHGLLGRLAEVATSVGTGVLTAIRGKHRRLFCFENGELIYADSNVIEEQFEATLIRRNLLPEAAIQAAARQAKDQNQKLGTFLREQGQPPLDELESAMGEHARGLLTSTANWSEADYSLSKGRPNLGNEPTSHLPVSDLLIQLGRRTSLPADKLRILIGPPNFRPVVSESPRSSRLVHAKLGKGVLELVALCDGSRDVAALVASSSGSEVDTLGTVYALTLLGVLLSKETDKVAIETGGVGEAELLAVLDSSESADHYGILGINPTASEAAVRDSYYYLARRFHPDRFRTGPLTAMLERVETYFTKVTEAYNTLHDAQIRTEYDRSREEKTTRKGPEQDPGYLARMNFARARVLVEKRRFHDAVQFLENARQLDSTNPAYHLELGRVLAMNPRRRADAEKCLKTALDMDPTVVDTYLVLGDLYLRMDRDSEAATMFQGVLNWEPTHPRALEELKNLGIATEGRAGGILRGLFKS